MDGDATYVMPVAEPTIFYSGDCYIIQHRYPTKGREEQLFYAWLGKNSVMVRTANTSKIFFQLLHKLEFCAFYQLLCHLIFKLMGFAREQLIP